MVVTSDAEQPMPERLKVRVEERMRNLWHAIAQSEGVGDVLFGVKPPAGRLVQTLECEVVAAEVDHEAARPAGLAADRAVGGTSCCTTRRR